MQKKQLLIIEDNKLNREMLKAILLNEYRVLEASNGQEGLEILRDHKEDIALILLDVMMPIMDGYDFLDIIKKDDELSLIPVIVTTKADQDEDEVSALVHGATDFVPKPYRPQVILHRVAGIIKLRETAAMINQFQYDRLTGLYTKEFFYQKVREKLNAYPDDSHAILCVNLENFKLYNDTFGRKEGDKILVEVSRIVSKVAGGKKYPCCRYGADRFLLLLNRQKKELFCEYFRRHGKVARSKRLGNVSVKFGMYNITNLGLPVEQMCDRAILAMDSIKGRYDKSFAIYDEDLRRKLLHEKAITDIMEKALKEEQFVVYYQPQYSFNDNCLIGAEALVRWIHPEWGMVRPDEFIPLFEKNGFISYLDQYVWDRVCKDLKKWINKGYNVVPVSVNVSRADIYRLDLVEVFTKLIKKYKLKPEYIRIEITETAYTDNPTQILDTVKALRDCGFLIELDDFGSGYSSLSAVGQMTMDVLKLDMHFVWSEMEKPAEKCLLSDVINMAHRLKLNVIAEGVETYEQVKRLKTMECDFAQGYYFSKPIPTLEIEDLLAQHKIKEHVHVMPAHIDTKPILLVVNEDEEYKEKIQNYFRDIYNVMSAETVKEVDEIIDENGLDDMHVLLLSLTLENNMAVSIIKKLRRNPASWKVPVICTTPCVRDSHEVPAVLDADDLICTGFPVSVLHRRIDRLNDLAVLKKRENVLHDKANRDYLTGLLNRRGLSEALEALRKDEMPLAVCMFDLDNLKQLNDNYGHNVGDYTIAMFADYLRRKSETGDIRCRYGGDEFVVVFKNVTSAEAAMDKCTSICREFTGKLGEEGIPGASSCGVVLCGNDEIPSYSLIEKADGALYKAKRENRGGCCLWKES